MIAVAQRIAVAPAANAQEMAMRIKQEAPGLADLAPEQLEQVARMVIAQRLTAELNSAVDLAGIDWQKERVTFLEDARSAHTRRAYAAALDRLEAWANREKINPLEMNAAAADNFIRELKAEGRAAASVRKDIAAVSAFFTWLGRYHSVIKNPVRGTRIRPPRESKKNILVPTAAEYRAIVAALPPTEKAIIACLALRGLRAGALPTLELKGNKYHGNSKGKKLTENSTAGITLPSKAQGAIRAAGLNERRPFAWITANAIERRINYHIGKIYKSGAIAAPYSCHDFRHYFAVTEYGKRKDIYSVSMLLNHANIAITQTYLKTLDVKL